MQYYQEHDISSILQFPDLIDGLKQAFCVKSNVPDRIHLTYDSNDPDVENNLLLMPAIQEGGNSGVKIVTVAPGNSAKNMESIHGIYYLFDSETGQPRAFFDAKPLTNWRTAAASALASEFLARKDAKSHFMIGTGALAPHIIRAQATVRPITQLMIYGRDPSKAKALANLFEDQVSVKVTDNIAEGVAEADIISTATLSQSPLIKGEWLREGQHLDLVGSFKPTHREVYDQAMIRTEKFLDTKMALKESGDLAIPLKEGIINEADIKGDLFGLCSDAVAGRQTDKEITLFKSVGYALEDLVAAQLVHRLTEK